MPLYICFPWIDRIYQGRLFINMLGHLDSRVPHSQFPTGPACQSKCLTNHSAARALWQWWITYIYPRSGSFKRGCSEVENCWLFLWNQNFFPPTQNPHIGWLMPAHYHDTINVMSFTICYYCGAHMYLSQHLFYLSLLLQQQGWVTIYISLFTSHHVGHIDLSIVGHKDLWLLKLICQISCVVSMLS